MMLLRFLIVLLLAACGLQAQPAVELVKDVNTGPPNGSSFPHVVTAGSVNYVTFYDYKRSTEIWTTDGTTAGTRFLKDVGSHPETFVDLNGILLFTTGRNLWRSNGAAESTAAFHEADSLFLLQSLKIGEYAFLVASDATYGKELWKTDGTASGTALIKDIRPGPDSSITDEFIQPILLNGVLFFAANDGIHGAELWRTDGSAAGTFMVKEIRRGPESSGMRSMIASRNTLFFVANNGINGEELWKSDGTAAGTVMVRDIRPGAESSRIGWMTASNGLLFFNADNGRNGRELWVSDGTKSNTRLVSDIHRGPAGTTLSTPLAANGVVYFGADEEVHGNEIWRSDGTSQGTFLLKDIKRGKESSDPVLLGRVGSHMIFTAKDGVHGNELWTTDGTSANTTLLKDMIPGGQSEPVANLKKVGDRFFVSLLYSLWITDGTPDGTRLLRNNLSMIYDDGFCSPVYCGRLDMFAGNGRLFFQADDRARGVELWTSDGTTQGTRFIKDFRPGNDGSLPSALTDASGFLYFKIPLGQLWRSNGTAPGTFFVAGSAYYESELETVNGNLFFYDGSELFFINPVAGDGPRRLGSFSNLDNPVSVDRLLFFTHFNELWRSDGTPQGTAMVKSFRSIDGSFTLSRRQGSYNGSAFFNASDGVNSGLWKSNGTAAGTVFLRAPKGINFTAAGSALFFVAGTPKTGEELWRTDGTPGGTFLVKDINPGNGSSYIGSLTSVNGTLFFSASDGVHGTELWKSDGTAQGTVMVKDIHPGVERDTPLSSHPELITDLNGVALFAANSKSGAFGEAMERRPARSRSQIYMSPPRGNVTISALILPF